MKENNQANPPFLGSLHFYFQKEVGIAAYYVRIVNKIAYTDKLFLNQKHISET